jgi:PAS domain S-box-containing protein
LINVWALTNLFTFLIAVSMIVFLIIRNPRARLNRLCALLMFIFAVWSLGFFCMNVSKTVESAMLWGKISSLGWLTFPLAALYFVFALIQKERLLKSKPLFILLALITAFFIYQNFTNQLVVKMISNPWGWSGVWSTSLIPYLFFAYFCLTALTIMGLTIDLWRKAATIREKRRAQVQLISIAIALSIGSVTDFILPVIFGLRIVPQLSNLLIVFWQFGLVISVTRYGLMTLTPIIASDRILSTMTDSLMLLDTRGIIKMANRAAVLAIETPEKDLIGTDFESHVLEKASVKSFLGEILRQETSVTRDFTYISRSGNNIQVQVSASRIMDNLNTTLGFVVVARDITELKLVQQSLSESEQRFKNLYDEETRLRRQLEEEAKLRLRFIDILAHELRSPMTPIIASSELLQELLKDNSATRQKKLADNICIASRVMVKRLEELLDVARFSRGDFSLNLQLTDMPLFINEVLSRYQPSINLKNQTLTLRIAADLPSARIDPSRIEQVIVNLLSNACKYSNRGSFIEFCTTSNNNELLFEVKDQGIGISSEDQKLLFQPYQRVGKDAHQYKGLGLGLTVVKQIIETHGGKIWVSSELGRGSTFGFTIPLK